LSQPVRDPFAPAPPVGAVPVTIRQPTALRLRLRDILDYGPIIRALAGRDIKSRYKQSALGPAWVVFQPLALLLAFSVGFKSVAHIQTAGVPYFLFAIAGLAVWTYFQATVMTATNSIVNNYALVRWTSCPRLALPLATAVSSGPSFAVTGIAAIGAAGIGGYLWIGTLAVPLLIIWLALLSASVAVFLAGISVRARDVVSVVPFLLQIALFVSPVAYSSSQLPSHLRSLISLNPLTGLIDAWRWSLLGTSPDWGVIGTGAGMTAVIAIVAWRTFSAIEVVMSDEI
jgi:lipopolysaccharide transport system permease protein